MDEVLFTIGTSKKSLRQFVGQLRAGRIDLVIDTRLRNRSQLAGFAKRADLEFLLTELLGIPYRHETDLAPPPELRDAFRKNRDWEQYATGFRQLIQERAMVEIVARAAHPVERPCLLCACPAAGQCHRRLIAEAVAAARPGLRVEHLE